LPLRPHPASVSANIGAVDELARSTRVIDDLTVGESATVLPIDLA
jgi:hypothetical protein